MTEFSENKKNNMNVLHLIIAILVLVSVVQTIALIQQNKNQKELAANYRKQISMQQELQPRTERFVSQATRQAPQAWSNLFHKPRAATNTSATPAVPAAGFFDTWDHDPFEEFDAISRRMSNMMRQAFLMSGPLMNQAVTGMSQIANSDFMPAIDLQETDKTYIVRGDLPGLDKDKINITVQNNMLTLQGIRETGSETSDSKQGFYSQERSYGSFTRTLALPGPVDENKISAEYKNGVLTITLPKLTGQEHKQKVTIQ
ncbi:MAG TPA: Hsp20/alpha crystallin family protein [Candidatus Omnitrophota bacterium]|nr:Hsp20/alpha crystallin family protein [Candidatus Omnitrophota bacterium]